MSAVAGPTDFDARAAIIFHAAECEYALQCAATVLRTEMAERFQKLAALHSDAAFRLARTLQCAGGA